ARDRAHRPRERGREAGARLSLKRALLVLTAAAAALALPAAAWAHAGLVRTVPTASVVVNKPPPVVLLTYTEAVEPRFAAVSVTDASGKSETAGVPRRSATDPKTLVVPLHRVAQGWYLVFELVFALFVVAALLALWIDRPEREQRSIAELLSVGGALAGAGAALLIPGLAGHAAQTSPRGALVLFDWLHLVSGSLWVGG